MEDIYCHKCKKKTKNTNAIKVKTNNDLWRIAAKCKICGTNKSKFIKKPEITVEDKQPKILSLNERLIEATELHRPVRKKFEKRKIVTYGIDDLWAADLVIMTNYEKENEGYKYILNVIDTFSKFAWSEALKKKDGVSVAKAFENIIGKAKQVNHKPPKFLHTDKGLEFKNKIFYSLLQKYNIKLYHTENAEKSAIVERFNGTLARKMKVIFEFRKNFKWIDILQNLINEYNYKDIHRTIGMKPCDVKQEIYTVPKIRKEYPVFVVGDRVRIATFKKTFQNKYKNNWSREIFVVCKIMNTSPITYKIKDLNNEEIKGTFYKEELLLTEL